VSDLTAWGLLLLVIGVLWYLSGKWYAWLGKAGRSGDTPLLRGWRKGSRFGIVVGKYLVGIGALLMLVGVVLELF
jgi:hypothetical protein